MAAIASASPTPITSTYDDGGFLRPASHNVLRSTRRPYTKRSSPQAVLLHNFASSTRTIGGESSDDEDPAPIKLSAEAQAILGEDNSHLGGAQLKDAITALDRRMSNRADLHVESLPNRLASKSVSPGQENGSPLPRLVKVSAPSRPAPLKTIARDGSFMYKTVDKTAGAHTMNQSESKTPASHLRSIRVSGSRSQTRSPPSTTLSNGRSVGSNSASDKSSHSRGAGSPVRQTESPNGDIAQNGPSTVSRPRKVDEYGVQSTMRVRRIGAGTFLNGPVRRGMIRRQSEEDEVPGLHEQDREAREESPEIQVGRRGHEPDLEDRPEDLLLYNDSPLAQQALDARFKAGAQRKSPVLSPTGSYDNPNNIARSASPVIDRLTSQVEPTPVAHALASAKARSSSSGRPKFSIPSLPSLPSAFDQENEPPPTFKRNKVDLSGADEVLKLERTVPAQMLDHAKPSSGSPLRQPLAPRQQNTPHRPAPAPPPKMSMLEAATSVAGSARSKKSVHITINGKEYRRLDNIGRGGSSRVYRIMADNYRIFALKRVNLEDADMAAIAGYKGEIDLLRRLENVDRVIRLFDYEVKEDKGILNVMMELGESDFNKMLNEQLKSENAKLDITFTRHYWKEMLECVRAVHDHDIVHSDLKPANFLLVKGQLKLIDFGIANKIADDTVNVHRENQIGTPNYMSPESLVCHTPALGAPAGTKILKLGKPSDIWSLGCILYQMTYGQPPFAHITKQFERIMSIPNPKVEISFPSTGIGGAVVPFGLVKTLRRCLTREQSLRPTVEELLNDTDPFLCPVAISADMLGRVISNVVGYVRKREEQLRVSGELGKDGVSCCPKDEEMRGWPAAFYEKLRQAAEEGTAW